MKKNAVIIGLFAFLILNSCGIKENRMSDTQKEAVDNSLAYISESAFSAKDRIDKREIEISKVTSGDLKFIWNEDLKLKESSLDTSDWVITIGDTSGHDFAVMICDSKTSEVLGYIPIE